MRRPECLLIMFCAATFVFGTNVFAQQDPAKVTESVVQTTDKIENLRTQITEIETKKAGLQDRIRQLDEAMLPENLERTTVAAGSTRPEELRENRRLQLETERKGVQSQIDLLEQSRLRIEMSIATSTPKPVPAETAPAKTQNVETVAQPEKANEVTPETVTSPKPPNSPAKRNPAKLRRKRIVKSN